MNFNHYLIHLRPASFLPSFIFTLSGYAISIKPADVGTVAIELIQLFFIFSILLFGGTCAINSFYDKDTGPINFLTNPPLAPKYLHIFGYFCHFMAFIVGCSMGGDFFKLIIISIILSFIYSVPIGSQQWRGKNVPIVDNLINAIGCGFISFNLGYTFNHHLVDLNSTVFGIIFTLTVFGSFPVTQIFQIHQTDVKSKFKNYTTYLGVKKSLYVGYLLIFFGTLAATLQIYFNEVFYQNINTKIIFFILYVVITVISVLIMKNWSINYSYKDEKKNLNYKNQTLKLLLVGRLMWIVFLWR